ncbi:hypothetical protein FD754_025666 [Muntiacus muntjak]|uniref:Trophoblast protein 1 n=1 Tax=Muntiacus muntjak TaxID=9888 RepID=A0A5N3UHM2_MUNMU|nr:hypothetical protein FD754_025666 [Muntiacus muntjak]
MALPISVLLALGMLCSSPVCSLGCELPASHGNLESFTRWSQMERVSIVSCLRDRTDQISSDPDSQVFSTMGSSMGPYESLLDRFLKGLDQQLEELDTCLREGRSMEHSPLGREKSRLAGKSYFQRISVYLKEKEYSCCAWEVVSVEIRRSLVLANKLIGKLRK